MARPTAKNRRTRRLSARKAVLKDLDLLVRQRRAMWMDLGVKDASLHNRADRAYRRWAKPRLESGKLIGWLVEDEEGTNAGSGCLWLQPVQPSPRRTGELQPYLLSMYTDPRFRRQGVASMIVNQAIAWCRKHGHERLTLHASEVGAKVYEQFGFKRGREMRLDLGKAPTKPRGIRRTIRRKT